MIYTSKDKRYAIAQQTTFGTAIADSAAFVELDCQPFEINPDIRTLEGEGSHGIRAKNASDVQLHGHGAMPSVQLQGVAKKNELDWHVAAFFQNASEGATTPYSKTFTFPATQPDFSADAGYFFTLISRNPDASKSQKITDMIAKSLELNIDMGGVLMYSVELVGRGAVGRTSDPSGTWTRAAADVNTDFWHWAGDGTNSGIVRATLDDGSSNDLVMTGPVRIRLEQTVDVVGAGGASAFDNFGLSNRMGTIEFVCAHSNFATVKDAEADNTLCVFNLAWGNATAGTDDGDLDFTCRCKITKATESNENVLGVKVQAEIVYDASSANGPTLILANAIDRGW